MIGRSALPSRRRWLFPAGLCLALPAAQATPAAPTADADAYVVTAKADDIVARRRGGTIVFSARAFAAAEQTALRQARGADLVTVRHRFAFVSLAGPFLAIRDQVDINTASPIPGGSTRFWTIDLRQPATYRFDDEEPLAPLQGDRTLVDLRQFFSPATLAAAIGATPLGAPWTGGAPRDLRAVLSDLSKRGMADGRCFGADAGVTSSFAVIGRGAGHLRVRLGLPGQAYCRDALTPLTIDLPMRGPLAVAIGPGPVSISRAGTTIVDLAEHVR